MTQNKDLHNITAWDSDFKSIKQNETDYQAFQEFQKELDQRYAKIEQNRMIIERKKSLALWDAKTPQRWRGASLSKIKNPAASEILKTIENNGYGSFFLSGDAGCGKTYIAYAIIRKFIGAGIGSFSNTVITNENSVLSLAFTGFEGKNKFAKLLDSKNKIYLFDNIGNRDGHYIPEKELALVEELIDHIYANSLYAIFTSYHTAEEYSNLLSESSRAKLLSIVNNRDISIPLI